MLVFGCSTGLKILWADLTWARHVYYRRTVSDYFRIATKQFSSRQTALPVEGWKSNSVDVDEKHNNSLAGKVRQRVFTKRERMKPRDFSLKELEEERKFEKFLSERIEKKDDELGELEQKNLTEDSHENLHTTFLEEDMHAELTNASNLKRYNLPKGWSGTFGSLSTEDGVDSIEMNLDPSIKYSKEIREEEKKMNIYDHVPLGTRNRKHKPDWYSRRILKLGKQGHIAEAIAVFDEWMLKEDRVKPTDFEYSVLISVLGKVGFTEKAFKLFNEMVKKNYRIHPKVLTALFNACSNSPWPEDGLNRARSLRRLMLIKEQHPKYITYQAMIKAFGVCGDLKTAFELADESVHFYKVTNNLLTSLLLGCVSDKEAGFRHAVMAWQQFQRFGVVPCVRSYKLLLKATRDCGVGEQKLLEQILDHDPNQTPNKLLMPTGQALADTGSVRLLDGSQDELGLDDTLGVTEIEIKDITIDNDINHELSEAVTDNVTHRDLNYTAIDRATHDVINDTDRLSNVIQNEHVQDMTNSTDVYWYQGEHKQEDSDLKKLSNLPNVLDPDADFSQIVSLGKVETGRDRFALLGGLNGFLRSLKENNVQLDVEIFTLTIDLVPIEEINLVLDEMIKAKVKPDTVFFNKYFSVLMHAGKQKVEDLADVMKLLEIEPDIVTFSTLASGCRNADKAKSLLSEMEKFGIMPNVMIMHKLIKASSVNFPYKKYLLNKMVQLDIKPDNKCLTIIEKDISKAHQMILDMDKGNKKVQKPFIKSFDTFLTFYEEWTKKVDMKKEDHPWKRFYLDN